MHMHKLPPWCVFVSAIKQELPCQLHDPVGTKLDASDFPQQRLKNFRRSDSTGFLICSMCDHRVNDLKERFQELPKTKFYCTCQKPVHQEKCPLFHPSRNWPGKDFKGRARPSVTQDDCHFLDQLPLHPQYSWWHKLWGRRLLNAAKNQWGEVVFTVALRCVCRLSLKSSCRAWSS